MRPGGHRADLFAHHNAATPPPPCGKGGAAGRSGSLARVLPEVSGRR